MKHLFILAFASILFSCASSKNGRAGNSLNGTWVPIQEEIGGRLLPAMAFERQQLVLSDSNYTMVAESVDKGLVIVQAGNKMDIYGKEGVNKGKHFMAIYEYKKEQLTICYNLMGNGYPEAFDTKGKPMYFLAVFKKAG